MDISVEEVYTKYIKDLPLVEKLRLLEMTARDLADGIELPMHSLLELEGLGAELLQGIDPQDYVDQLRKE